MKILVPISDERASLEALPKALELAREGDSQIVLASIGEQPEVSEHAAETRSALERRLAEVAAGIVGVPVYTRTELAGDPVRGIMAIAREEHVDRIVMASHDRGAFESLVDGSVAEELRDELDRIPVTVVTV